MKPLEEKKPKQNRNQRRTAMGEFKREHGITQRKKPRSPAVVATRVAHKQSWQKLVDTVKREISEKNIAIESK